MRDRNEDIRLLGHINSVHPEVVNKLIKKNIKYFKTEKASEFIILCMIDLASCFGLKGDYYNSTNNALLMYIVGDMSKAFSATFKPFGIHEAFKAIYSYAEDFIELPEHIEFDLRMKGYI